MELSERVRGRRLELGLGIRETARHTEMPYIPHPIKSPIYISRIEAGGNKHMPTESVTIDKTWALGCALRMDPLELFLLSRGHEDLVPFVSSFSVRDCEPQAFGQFVHNRRRDLGLSMRDAANKATAWYISVGYWSQMETDFRECTTKISGEKLWGMGIVLDVDPLLLYVLSRKMDARYLKSSARDLLFY